MGKLLLVKVVYVEMLGQGLFVVLVEIVCEDLGLVGCFLVILGQVKDWCFVLFVDDLFFSYDDM